MRSVCRGLSSLAGQARVWAAGSVLVLGSATAEDRGVLVVRRWRGIRLSLSTGLRPSLRQLYLYHLSGDVSCSFQLTPSPGRSPTQARGVVLRARASACAPLRAAAAAAVPCWIGSVFVAFLRASFRML